MSFPWSHYLDLAKALAGQETNGVASQEARLRSAISRAYYAVFCTARNRAHAEGRRFAPPANPH